MNYFYEIIDKFNSIYDRRVLLNESSKAGHVAFMFGGRNYNTLPGSEGEKKLIDLGFNETEIKNLPQTVAGADSKNRRSISPQANAGVSIEAYITKGGGVQKKEGGAGTTQNATAQNQILQPPPVEAQAPITSETNQPPLPAQPVPLTPEQQRQKDVDDALLNLESAATKAGVTPPSRIDLTQPKVMSISERIKRAAYFTVKKLLGREDKIEADKARIGTAKTLTRALDFITTEMPDPEKDLKEFKKWQSEARFLYEKIKINGHDVNSIDRKLLIESEEGDYTSALGDSAIVENLKNLLEFKFKQAFKTIEDPTGEKVRIKESDRTGQISSKNLGENFEITAVAMINMSGYLERARRLCMLTGSANVDKARSRCLKAMQERDQAFESLSKIMKENSLDFMKLTTGLNEDLIGRTPEIRAVIELINETTFAGSKEGTKKAFLALNYLISQNPLYNNASMASRMGHETGLGDRQDVHLFYESREKAEEASKFSKHQYIEVPIEEVRNNPDLYYHFTDKEKMEEYFTKRLSEGNSTVFIINPSMKVTAQDGSPRTKMASAGGYTTVAVSKSIAKVNQNGERDNSGHREELIETQKEIAYLEGKGQLTSEEAISLKKLQDKLPILIKETEIAIKKGSKFAATIEQLTMEVLRAVNPEATDEELEKEMRESFGDVVKSKEIHLGILSLDEVITKTSTGKEIVVDTLEKTKEVLETKLKELGVEIDVAKEITALYKSSKDGEIDKKELDKLKTRLNNPKYQELRAIVKVIEDNFSTPLTDREKDPAKHKLEVRSRRQAALRTVTGLENIGLATSLESKDPKVRSKAARKIIADLMVNAAASQKDLSVIDVNLSKGESTTFSHNVPLQIMAEGLMKGTVKFNPTQNGYSLQDEKSGATISVFYEDLSGERSQSTICRVDYNEKAKKLGEIKGSYISTKLRREDASKIYNRKLELLEQIINDQRNLLLKLIDIPEINTGK